MDIGQLPKLATAVNRWLSYQLLCGREPLLSEAYLGQPLAEYLMHRHSGTFEAECNHPAFETLGEGRPRQIDYVLRTPHTGAIEVAIECKWITDTAYSRQRILNDILRLECVRQEGRHVERYLLVAGRRPHFTRNFRTLAINNAGGKRLQFTKEILPLGKGKRTIPIRACATPFRRFYLQFSKDFDTGLPPSFTTTVLARRTADDISVCIWRIGSVNKRTLFQPTDVWK